MTTEEINTLEAAFKVAILPDVCAICWTAPISGHVCDECHNSAVQDDSMHRVDVVRLAESVPALIAEVRRLREEAKMLDLVCSACEHKVDSHDANGCNGTAHDNGCWCRIKAFRGIVTF